MLRVACCVKVSVEVMMILNHIFVPSACLNHLFASSVCSAPIVKNPSWYMFSFVFPPILQLISSFTRAASERCHTFLTQLFSTFTKSNIARPSTAANARSHKPAPPTALARGPPNCSSWDRRGAPLQGQDQRNGAQAAQNNSFLSALK